MVVLFGLQFSEMAESAETLRSRLYRLELVNGEENWVERGEGYPEFKRQESLFRLRYFSFPGRECLYDVVVDTNIQFERADNGVQWTQVRENEVMALSFKEPFSANAFWQLIQDYNRKYAISVPAAQGIYFYFQYKVPDPTPFNLPQVLQELECIPQKERPERVASIFLTKRDLLPKLLNTFRKVEQAGEMEKLEIMFNVVKIMFNASNEQLYYELLCNQSFTGVLGILEYDPNFRNQRPKHREFINSRSRLMEVVPFRTNPDLLNLVVFTYRLQYVRECVLFPYLDDNGFLSSGCIIRNNYKKIINQIFSPRRKDFINSLYDLLRLQDVGSFKLLREIFRVARIHYVRLTLWKMPEIYQQIADKDTFDIFLKNFRELLTPNEVPSPMHTRKKKRKPEELEQIVQACLQILEQYMEHEPQHLRNYLSSQGEKILKYPGCEFLIDQFEHGPPHISSKLDSILKALFSTESHPLKDAFKVKIMEKLMDNNSLGEKAIKWLPLFHQILVPAGDPVAERLKDLTGVLMDCLKRGSKGKQIYHISVFKTFMHNYIIDQVQIETLLKPHAEVFATLMQSNRGADGIRVSAILALFVPPKYHGLAQEIARLMREKADGNGLILRYADMLERLSIRKQFILPTTLKRDCSDRALDEQNFQKLSKKIKID